MIKIVGRDVLDPGPLAKADYLYGDFTGAFNYSWLNPRYTAGPLRGLDNAHEGVYLDNIVIGFAERGEMVSRANPNTTFVARPDIDPDTTITTGPYQLNIRTAENYGIPSANSPFLVVNGLGQTIDTNDRLVPGAVTLTAPAGRELSDGQTFTLTSDSGTATFEYVDSTIDENNDTLATAAKTNLVAGQSGTYIGIGQLGHNAVNNDNSLVAPGADVDIIELDLLAGDRVIVDVDAFNPDDNAIQPSPLDSVIRIFNENGTQIVSANDVPGPGDLDIRNYFFDPSVTFTAPQTGKFYVGISHSGNEFYNPNVMGSGFAPLRSPTFRQPTLSNNVIWPPLTPLEVSGTLQGGSYEVEITLNAGADPGDTVPVPFSALDTPERVANRLTRAINSAQAQSEFSVSAGPRENGRQIDLHGSNVMVANLVEGRDLESDDTLATANDTNAVIGRATTFRTRGVIGNQPDMVGSGLDVDIYRLEVQAGAQISVDVKALENGSTLAAAATLMDVSGTPLVVSTANPAAALDVPAFWRQIDPLTAGDRRESGLDPVIRYLAPETGTYYVAISARNNVTAGTLSSQSNIHFNPFEVGSGVLSGLYQNTGNYEAILTVGDGGIAAEVTDETVVGDGDVARPQGQLLIAANRILRSAEYGIRSDATRDADGYPFPGATANLPEINVNRLVPGVTITNNIIASSGTGGILISGNADVAGQQEGAVPFGRLINNTLVGLTDAPTGAGIGIEVSENSSPTLLNNIISQFETGIQVDATSSTTVVGGTLYHANTANTNTPAALGLGDFPLLVPGNETLFVDAATDNYYIAEQSLAIDSSVDSLPDRADLIDVRSQLNIPVSPILAPDFDVAGQLRIDDPNVQTPVGQGENVFKDRGALDRSDFTGPTANLVVPFDNAAGDRNPTEGDVATNEQSLSSFVIELSDRTLTGGAGINDESVGPNSLELRRSGRVLTEGIDYVFEYDPTNDLIRLSPIAGIWAPNESYVITFANSVEDLAGNALAPNQLSGATILTVTSGLGADYGDAPAPYPTLNADDGARHSLVENFFLGESVDADSDGEQATDANIDAHDDGVLLSGLIARDLVNLVTVSATGPGFLDAWIDWNQDGDWDDSGEQIFTRRGLNAGDNDLEFDVASNVPFGETFARFRFSSVGGLDPFGAALDGEVEDYRVVVGANPWHNQSNRLDVNNDGDIAPLDVLLIINELDSFVFADPVDGRLPLPSPEEEHFLDTSNDGFVSPIDALRIINHLDEQNRAAAAPLAASLPTFEPITVMTNSVADVRSKDAPARAEVFAELTEAEGPTDLPQRHTQNLQRNEITRRRLNPESSQQWDQLVDQAWDLDDDLFAG